MTSTPNVTIKNMFTPSLKNLNQSYKTPDKVKKETMNMFDYYADEKKKAFFMLDYFGGKIGKENEMNIIFENGEYATKEEIEKRKKQYVKYIENSNIYKLVISFPENYLEENVDIKKFEKDLAKHIIPMFLKKCGFDDIKKMSYQFSLHTNTDNLHFHLSFAEKKPNYIRKNNKEPVYRRAGKLEQKEISFLKNEIDHYIHREKFFTPLLKETNKQLKAIIGDYMLESATLSNKIIKSLGIDTIIVSSPEDIFELVKEGNKVDFIITNNLYNNSKYDGFQIAYHLKIILNYEKPLIILTSSYNQDYYFLHKCGFDGYLTKPLEIEKARETVLKLIPDLKFIKID